LSKRDNERGSRKGRCFFARGEIFIDVTHFFALCLGLHANYLEIWAVTARMSRSCLCLEVVANAALALERNISGAFGLIGVGSGVAGVTVRIY